MMKAEVKTYVCGDCGAQMETTAPPGDCARCFSENIEVVAPDYEAGRYMERLEEAIEFGVYLFKKGHDPENVAYFIGRDFGEFSVIPSEYGAPSHVDIELGNGGRRRIRKIVKIEVEVL